MGVGGRPGEEAGCNAQNNGFGAFWGVPQKAEERANGFFGTPTYTFREIPA